MNKPQPGQRPIEKKVTRPGMSGSQPVNRALGQVRRSATPRPQVRQQVASNQNQQPMQNPAAHQRQNPNQRRAFNQSAQQRPIQNKSPVRKVSQQVAQINTGQQQRRRPTTLKQGVQRRDIGGQENDNTKPSGYKLKIGILISSVIMSASLIGLIAWKSGQKKIIVKVIECYHCDTKLEFDPKEVRGKPILTCIEDDCGKDFIVNEKKAKLIADNHVYKAQELMKKSDDNKDDKDKYQSLLQDASKELDDAVEIYHLIPAAKETEMWELFLVLRQEIRRKRQR